VCLPLPIERYGARGGEKPSAGHIAAAAAEIRRTKAMGLRPALLPDHCDALPLNNPEWNPVWEAACEPIEAAGYRTERTIAKGETLDEDFFHGLGHGVGVEVHEAPNLGLAGDDLFAGDVVTIEPGVYRKGFGGVRLEDMVVVTGDGCENLTQFDYELEIRP